MGESAPKPCWEPRWTSPDGPEIFFPAGPAAVLD